ncbi:MFS transporter [Methanosalsum zhilinae]|uniref:MFS transporter n=1 Tax=Methanosalsum zhilinae TaxID=39669 RepID=UPI001FDFE2AD|nr:MFS transporter [Methanosalsum zhilinae]
MFINAASDQRTTHGKIMMSDARNTYIDRERQIFLLSTGTFCIFLALLSLIPLLPMISDELAISRSELGWVAGVFMICMALFQIPFGLLSDRFGRRPMIISGMLIFTAGVFMLGISSTFVSLLAARAISGIGAAIFFTTSFTMVGDLYRLRERGHAMGILAIATGFGTVLGYSMGGLLGDLYGWRFVFIWFSALTLLVAISFLLLKETGYCTEGGYCYRDMIYLSFDVFRIKSVVLVTLIAMMCNMASIGSSYVLPFYAQDAGMSVAVTGLIFIPFAIVSSAGASACGKCSDIVGRRRPLIVVTTIAGLALVIFSWLPVNAPAMAVNFALVGLCFGPVVTLTSTILVDHVVREDSHILGTSMGTFNMIRWMGAAFGPVAGGIMLEVYGPELSFMVFGLLILISAVLSIMIYEEWMDNE